MIDIYYWRVTKYNPLNRDKNGFYKKNEWISIGDIGTKYDNVEFTFDSYIFYENLYVDAVLKIMSVNKVESLKIEELKKSYYKSYVKKYKGLEKSYYSSYADLSELETKKQFDALKNNKLASKHEIEKVIRFALREIIWCKLTCGQMFVHFGYDYYMYFGSELYPKDVLETIEANGLFVEDFVSPYL